MNPQQDYLGPSNNPYDFIMNPEKSPKKRAFGLDPLLTKILLIVAAVFGLMVIIAIVLNFAAPKQVSAGDLIALAQTQQEIIRVAHQGSADAVQQTTKNLAITTEFSLKTQQSALLQYLADHGTDVDEKQLGLKQDADTDLKLKEAKQTSTFDITFSGIIEEELRKYANTMNTLFNSTQNEDEQDLLSNNYGEAQLLIAQVPYTRDAIEDANN